MAVSDPLGTRMVSSNPQPETLAVAVRRRHTQRRRGPAAGLGPGTGLLRRNPGKARFCQLSCLTSGIWPCRC